MHVDHCEIDTYFHILSSSLLKNRSHILKILESATELSFPTRLPLTHMEGCNKSQSSLPIQQYPPYAEVSVGLCLEAQTPEKKIFFNSLLPHEH